MTLRERSRRGHAASGTRTFFFCDLRGYTTFVEERGDSEAADLLRAYRRLVRARVSRSHGAEIKTEGDSFFVAFATARDALACAIAIFHDAERHSAANTFLPIEVGAGLHSGEPVAQDRGYVGSAVNIAARLAQNAEARELLMSETVRGLLRTSGLPPLAERTDLTLKGVADAPRVWSVDWRAVSQELAGPPVTRRLPRWTIAAGIGAVLISALALGASRLSTGAPIAPTVSAPALPPHGTLLFELDRTPAGGRQIRIGYGDEARDAVRFISEAVEISVSPGSTVSVTVLDLSPDDFVAELAVVTVRGQGTYALSFRGADGRQIQAQVAPQTGELVVQVVRPLSPGSAPERLFGPASRVPRGAEQRFALAARGPDLVIYRDGTEIARTADPRPVGGAMGLIVTAPRDREFALRVTALRVWAP